MKNGRILIMEKILVLIAALLVTGCANLVPSRYYSVELELSKDDKVYNLKGYWRCDLQPFANGTWKSDKQIFTWFLDGKSAVAAKLSNQEKSAQFNQFNFSPECKEPDKNANLYVENLFLVDNYENITCYDQYYPAKASSDASQIRLISSRIVKSSRSEYESNDVRSKVSALDPMQIAIKNSLNYVVGPVGYRGYRAVIVPESVWKSNSSLASFLNTKKSIFFAGNSKTMSDQQHNFRRGFFQLLLERQGVSTKEILVDGYGKWTDRGIIRRGLVWSDDHWEMEQEPSSFVRKCNASTNIRYSGNEFNVSGTELIYDPKERQIIYIVEE